MIAESAVIGRRNTLFASARSMMTTWFCSLTFSRTQMKWSDSRVSVCVGENGQRCAQDGEGGDADCATRILAWNEMDAGWMPRLESWRCSQKAMGFEISMVVVVVVVVGRKEHVELVELVVDMT